MRCCAARCPQTGNAPPPGQQPHPQGPQAAPFPLHDWRWGAEPLNCPAPTRLPSSILSPHPHTPHPRLGGPPGSSGLSWRGGLPSSSRSHWEPRLGLQSGTSEPGGGFSQASLALWSICPGDGLWGFLLYMDCAQHQVCRPAGGPREPRTAPAGQLKFFLWGVRVECPGSVSRLLPRLESSGCLPP